MKGKHTDASDQHRGTITAVPVRYETLQREPVGDDGYPEADEEALWPQRIRTELMRDRSRSVISHNDSPDVPFERSLNPYRGCEHGCIYCFARPSHAWLGLSPGIDFESRLLYKPDAAKLLSAELAARNYRCTPLAVGINTDAYQPVEQRLGITRSVLEVLAAHQHPFSIVTKSALIERDLDILQPLAEKNLVQVAISVTTLDNALSRKLEPRSAVPKRRLQTIRTLSTAGIPVTVLVAPVIPFLNDSELEAILEQSRGAGAAAAGYVMLRLPHEVKQLFAEWLQQHVPLKADHIMQRIRDLHGGREYDASYGTRMTGSGEYATLIAQRFRNSVRRLAFPGVTALDCSRFHSPATAQMPLF